MKARLTFLAGRHRGRRLVLKDHVISIGEGRSHTVSLGDSPAGDLLALIERHEGSYRIVARHPRASLVVNGAPVAHAGLHDGDLIRLGSTHKIRFGTVPERREIGKPLRQIVRHSWRAAAHLDAGLLGRGLFFFRDLCHCTACDASRKTTVASAAALVVLVFALLLAGVSLVQTRSAERRVVVLSEQVAAGTASRRHLEQQIATLHQVQQEKARTDTRLGEIVEQLETAERRQQVAIDAARQSVAFILVGYALYDKATGKPLRFVADAGGAPQHGREAIYEPSVDGTGPIATSYSTGSGFVIAGSRLVTNHHVAEPWWQDASVDAAIERGLEPRSTVARAYFPGRRHAVDLRVVAVSADADVAVMAGAIPAELPPLALAPPARQVMTGEPVIVLGYPTGFDALLAKTGETLARQILERVGDDPPRLARTLATRNLISPLVTMGHVGDVPGESIVYDAATTHGGSGGPVLNGSGEVIAVNYAMLQGFSGAQFGIPIRFVHKLLSAPRPKGTK